MQSVHNGLIRWIMGEGFRRHFEQKPCEVNLPPVWKFEWTVWVVNFQTLLADSLMDQIHVLLDKIRPDAVGLVDALGFDDEQLKSTPGRYDGNVYEAI